MIIIIDYNMGNLQSVQKAFNRIGVESKISRDPEELRKAKKLVLPGVGHFKNGMKQLSNLNLIEILNEQVIDFKKPILGICLGMQLFTKYSTEGGVEGLGWIDANTVKFDNSELRKPLKVPHMGWNNLHLLKGVKLLHQINSDDMFYFVHSYYVDNEFPHEIVAKTEYGIDFTSIFQKENIYGVQFHPEKSHDSGLKLLSNFANLI